MSLERIAKVLLLPQSRASTALNIVVILTFLEVLVHLAVAVTY